MSEMSELDVLEERLALLSRALGVLSEASMLDKVSAAESVVCKQVECIAEIIGYVRSINDRVGVLEGCKNG